MEIWLHGSLNFNQNWEEDEKETLNSGSVQFNHSVMSDSLRHHGLQHTRPPCPSPAPGVHTDSRPLSQ